MSLTISAYATALFSSWYFISEYSLLLDAGDGVTAGLHQKSGKIKHVFLSHADRDHITGLLQLVQLNAREGFPIIHYPENSNSFPALADFSARFNPHVAPVTWQGIRPGMEISIGKNLVIVPVRNEHIPAPEDVTKSMGFILQQIRHKLRPEYAHLTGTEIASLRKERGDAAIMQEVRDHLLAYSGDTPVSTDGRWNEVHTLIHEATFIEPAHNDDHNGRYNKHSALPDVIAMVAKTNVQQLILGHFSLRYTHTEIIAAVREQCRLHGIRIPVYCILPGIVYHNLLREPPVYAP